MSCVNMLAQGTKRCDKRNRTPAPTPSAKPAVKKSVSVDSPMLDARASDLHHYDQDTKKTCKGKLSYDQMSHSKHSYTFINKRTKQRDTNKMWEAAENALGRHAGKDRKLAAMIACVRQYCRTMDMNELDWLDLAPDVLSCFNSLKLTFGKLGSSNREGARIAKVSIATALLGEGVSKATLHRLFGVGRRTVDQAERQKAEFLLAETPEQAARALLAKPRASRSDAVPEDLDANICAYFEDNASNSTRKRDGNHGRRKNFEGVPKKLLNGSVVELYNNWCILRRRSNLPTVSYVEFARRRPSHIKIRTRNDRIECACQRDVNMKLLLDALHKFRNQTSKFGVVFTSKLPPHVSDLVAECTCIPVAQDTSEEAVEHDFLDTKMECINGNCASCGTQVLDKYVEGTLAGQMDESIVLRVIKYEQFESTSKTLEDSEDPTAIKQVSRVEKVQKECSLQEFMSIFKSATAEHVKHMFRYRWQKSQLGDKVQMLQRPGHIAVGMDFSENHTVLEPQEVQSLHWTQQQIAILVMIVYSIDASASETNTSPQHSGSSTTSPTPPAVTMEQFFFVSKVLTKGCAFVDACILKLIQHLKDNGRHVDVIHFISDNCAGDFKSNHSMLDRAKLWMVTLKEGHKVTCMVNFSESGHGKGPWDGAGAWLKHTLHMLAINHNEVIREPADIARLVNDKYNKPSQNYNRQRQLSGRHCFVLEEDEIDIDNSSRAKGDIKGIRGMHQFDCPGGESKGVNDMHVGFRKLSCYCSSCLDRDWLNCENKVVVGSMTRVQMRPEDDATQLCVDELRESLDCWLPEVSWGLNVQPASGNYPVADEHGCWVAIHHDDVEYQEYSYYIMWVKDGPSLLKSSTRDGYRTSFSRGSTVLKGALLVVV